MARFNTAGTRAAVRSPVTTPAVPAGRTHEGATGYARDAQSELFLLAVAHMGDGSFYEPQADRDARLTGLIRAVAAADPGWMAAFVPWLRDAANMRTASALRRADEPGELLAYWTSRYGRSIPIPVKRGTADAVNRLYTERSLLKYDTPSHGYRFGDVIELVHPAPDTAWREDLYRHAISRRHNRDEPVPASLETVRASIALRQEAARSPRVLLDTAALQAAGMTWEDVLSLAGTALPKKDLWTALIPVMGYMATIRNLRNFDEAGLPDTIADRIADPEQVAKSRQFPFRFLAAHQATAGSMRRGWPLEQALNASLRNVPGLDGRTLVLVDRSASMFGPVTAKSGLNNADAAALFGTALALRAAHGELVQFGTGSEQVRFRAGDSVLAVTDRFSSLGGTDTADAVRRWYKRHDRVVIFTDEQAAAGYRGSDPLAAVPGSVPVYTWNLAGYRLGHGESGSGTRHTFGSLTDQGVHDDPAPRGGTRRARWDDLFAGAARD
jgi:hypothetical protein